MTTLIIGAGQAGHQVAESLRAGGYDKPIVLAGDEPHIPYQLPPLSKGYLKGLVDRPRLAFRSAAFYSDKNIDLRLGHTVAAIDLAARTATVKSSTGLTQVLDFEHLVFATGSRPVMPPIPGVDSERVCYMRTLDDADHFGDLVKTHKRFAVVGAGFIGLEAAASLRHFEREVVVIEAADRVMARVVSPAVSAFFEAKHLAEGVELRLSALCTSITETDAGLIVELSDGDSVEVDCLLMGVGARPNTELAETSGIDCDGGIMVDASQRTSKKGVFAAGDCCIQHQGEPLGAMRLESVQNAIDQAKVIAKNILGELAENHSVPWFWSDQFDVKYQMAGLSVPTDEAVPLGNTAVSPFSIAHFRDDALAAVESVNQPGDHMAARKLIELKDPVTKDQLSAAGNDLRVLFKQLR